jgi:hypothetical protein
LLLSHSAAMRRCLHGCNNRDDSISNCFTMYNTIVSHEAYECSSAQEQVRRPPAVHLAC